MEDHLRSVPEPNEDSAAASKRTRARSRARASKALPTDRLKFDAQVNALKAIAVTSNYGKRAVGADDIAPALGIASTTAGLNNNFFMESNLIVRESKGRYKPTALTSEFAQKHSFDPKGAGGILKDALLGTWYFQAVRQQLEFAKTTAKQMIPVLGAAAGAGAEYEPQLVTLLTWLEYGGCITTKDGQVRLTDDAAKEPVTPPSDDKDKPGGGAGEKPTTQDHRPDSAETVLSFSFEFALTADQLKELSPEQIQAAFKAVGEVMSIQAAMKN